MKYNPLGKDSSNLIFPSTTSIVETKVPCEFKTSACEIVKSSIPEIDNSVVNGLGNI